MTLILRRWRCSWRDFEPFGRCPQRRYKGQSSNPKAILLLCTGNSLCHQTRLCIAGGGEGGFRCSLRQCSMMLGLAWTLVIIASKRTIRTTMIVLQDIEVCKEDCIVDLVEFPTKFTSSHFLNAPCVIITINKINYLM